MTSLFVEDFKAGLDLRKNILTGQPGSLQTLDNCVITPGGEVQKRKAFVPVYTLPAGTVGLHGTSSDNFEKSEVWVFGSDPTTYGPSADTTLGYVSSGGTTYAAVNKHTVQLPAGETLQYMADVADYGFHQFFVVAGTQIAGLSNRFLNFWDGAVVTGYTGYAPFVSGSKMYRTNNSVLYFSGTGDPSVTNPLNPAGTGPNTVNPGAGFIDMSQLDSDLQWLVGMEAYYKQIAVFSRRCCVLWTMDPDPANNVIGQVLRIGAVSNDSIQQFGTGDVLFLSDSGVRSLRALNISLAAGVTDVGSPIDSLLQAITPSINQFVNGLGALGAKAIIEPRTGRYWLAIGNTIYVLSYWPSSKISAWSTFTLPFNVDYITVAGQTVYVRSGDTIYAYGGTDGNTYDDCVATVRTPFMSADTPTTEKKGVSIGAMVVGNWAMSVGMETDNPSYYELVANLSGDTLSQQKFKFAGRGTHIGFFLTCNDAAPSLLGAIAVRFEKAEEM